MLEKLKADLLHYRKNHGSDIAKDILRVLIGDIETYESRPNTKKMTDDQCLKMIKKLIQSNQEVIDSTHDQSKRDKLQEEIDFVRQYLPEVMSRTEVRQRIQQNTSSLKSITNFGKAMGFMMGQMKKSGKDFEAQDVKDCLVEFFESNKTG